VIDRARQPADQKSEQPVLRLRSADALSDEELEAELTLAAAARRRERWSRFDALLEERARRLARHTA
jgi:hypothetical protein